MTRPVTPPAPTAIPDRPITPPRGVMMTQPSDTDRIIAEHRKTRRLILWIFVGVPLFATFIAVCVLIANAISEATTPHYDSPPTVASEVSVPATCLDPTGC